MQNPKGSTPAPTSIWQLPWTPPAATASGTTSDTGQADEDARRAASRAKNAQRMRDMAAAKKEARLKDLEEQVEGLEALIEQGGTSPEVHWTCAIFSRIW